MGIGNSFGFLAVRHEQIRLSFKKPGQIGWAIGTLNSNYILYYTSEHLLRNETKSATE